MTSLREILELLVADPPMAADTLDELADELRSRAATVRQASQRGNPTTPTIFSQEILMALYEDGSTVAVGDHIRGAVSAQNAVDGYVTEVISGSLLRVARLTPISAKVPSFKGPALAVGGVGFVVDEAQVNSADFNKVA